ncbi:multipass membrane protein [Candidatus Mancarchaeum acidiphilum]|uniref:Multipass membrane protein n=1 Tax=Candidatus Mancarchaeum acidiphilum TaxID=1920749 RepID=A0A218NN12_9ARCH|nr:hypothetical protein [Candidatus Mancarchaeum acidiphilum]ASI13860.1 multipass membrane protein [Candidatus Mancarchaeum acidiphilum]
MDSKKRAEGSGKMGFMAASIIILLGSVIGYYILYAPAIAFGLIYLGIAIGIILFLISLGMLKSVRTLNTFAYIFFAVCCIFLPFIGGVIGYAFMRKNKIAR